MNANLGHPEYQYPTQVHIIFYNFLGTLNILSLIPMINSYQVAPLLAFVPYQSSSNITPARYNLYCILCYQTQKKVIKNMTNICQVSMNFISSNITPRVINQSVLPLPRTYYYFETVSNPI